MRQKLLITSCFAALLSAACQDAERPISAERSALMRVSVQRITSRSASQNIRVQGQIVARQSIRIVPELEGLRVQAVRVEEGERVKAGQVLVELAPISIDAELAQARANLARATAAHLAAKSQAMQAAVSFQRANTEFARYQEVIAVGAVSQEDADQRKATLDSAKQELLAAEQNASALAADVSVLQSTVGVASERNARLQIRAPVAGVLSDKHVEVGAVSSLNANPFFVLHPDGNRELEADLDLATLAMLNAQSAVEVHAQNRVWNAKLRLTNNASTTETAQLARAPALVVRNSDRRATVRFSIDQGGQLSIGVAASAQIQTSAQATVQVALSAVQFDPAPWVYVLDAKNQAQKRSIELSSSLAQFETLSVRAGLNEGDRVIAKAANLIVVGQRVAPVLLPDAPEMDKAVDAPSAVVSSS
jgi:HlyD family secretion protein